VYRPTWAGCRLEITSIGPVAPNEFPLKQCGRRNWPLGGAQSGAVQREPTTFVERAQKRTFEDIPQLARVDAEVEQGLMKLSGVAAHRPGIIRYISRDPHRPRERFRAPVSPFP
jgi:hypothetical protein